MTPQVLTANALIDGDVVYFAGKNGWVRQLSDAKVFRDAEEAQAALGRANAKGEEVVGAYLMTVLEQDGAPQPTHFREVFRQRGPSNMFHGKQADFGDKHDV